jgi:outer membrane protein TolC
MLLALIGCSSSKSVLPESPEMSAGRATGVGDAIQFDTAGGQIDAPGDVGTAMKLSQAVRLSLQTDARLQVALARVRMAQADSDQARLLPNPILGVAFRFPEGGGSTIIDAGIAADLIAVLRQPGRVSAADNRLRAASAEAVTVALDLSAEVQERYVAIQTRQAQLQVLQSRREIGDRLTRLASARLEAGEGTQLDVTTLQTQQVELETEIADQTLALREDRLALAKLIGQPSSRADWAVDPWIPESRLDVSETQWIALALANRPEVLAQRWELAALGDERSLSGLAPFDGVELGVEAERDDGWSVGPGVAAPLPIFDMGQAEKARAEAAVIEARHNLTESQRQVIQETRLAHAAFDASQANVARVRDELIPLQEKRLAQAEAQYQAGQTDLTDLFLAEQDLREARARLIELERTYLLSLVRLERAAGGAGAVHSMNDSKEQP